MKTGAGLKNKDDSYRMIANGYLFIQVTMWAFSFIVVKGVIAGLPTVTYLAIRLIAAALILLPFYFKKIREAFDMRFLKASAVLGTLYFLTIALQGIGLEYTSVTNSAFITSMCVIMLPVAERFLMKKKVHFMIWIGCFFAFAGTLILSGSFSFALNIGDILTFFCAVCCALHMVYTAKYVQELKADTLGASSLMVCGVLSAVMWGINGFSMPQIETNMIAGILYTSFFATSLGIVGQTVALKYSLPSVAGLIYTLEPIIATFFAAVIPDSNGNYEVLSPKIIAGALAIFAGVVLAMLSSIASNKNNSEKQKQNA